MAKVQKSKKAETTKPAAEPVAPVVSKKKAVAPGEPREYVSSDIFQEGERIYHKIWDDVGEIIEAGVTEDGIKKIRVQFEKVGLKTLCMGQSA